MFYAVSSCCVLGDLLTGRQHDSFLFQRFILGGAKPKICIIFLGVMAVDLTT